MLDPPLCRWGVPPVVIRCVHWTMQMWVLQTWIIAQGLAIVMEYICVTFTMLLLWVNLWYFGTWFRVTARAGCDKQCKYKYKVIAILPISEQNVFSLCAKWLVCPLFDISTIDQPLFRGWGPPLRGGIVIWVTRALPSELGSMISG